MMRVTSGIRKGALLLTAKDESIRPTADKVKQSVFNILQFEIAGRTVLDLFAGSGALGIEALSRGANHCTFVDIDPEIVRKNIAKLKLEENSEILRIDYLSFLNQTEKQYDLVFLDPPYQKQMAQKALFELVRRKLLLPNSLLVWECDASETVAVPKEIAVQKERKFGRIQIRIGAFK